jgi:hypothetical protein
MSRCGALVAGLLCLLSIAMVRAEDASSQWEAAFPTRDAPQQVYFRAGYHDDLGRTHRLEVWREADLRLRRRTDETIDLYVEKSGSGEYEYRLIDHDRKILIRADRATLYRIGVFSDWIGLAHVLNIPRSGYRVTGAARQSPASLRGECVWKRLELLMPVSSTSEVCWSSAWGLPLEIGAQGGKDGWESRFLVQEVGTFAPKPEIFAVAREGLVEIDAGPDGEVSD